MFRMTSLPVKAWLGGTARGRPRQVTPVCSHPQWNPADPELWVPRADTGSGGGWWVDPQRPHLSSGQPAASPDRQPVGFSHAPRAALPGCSALFPALPGHGSATNRAPLPRRSSAVPRAPRPVLRLHCAGVEVPELGCSPAQGQVSGPFREPHVAEWSQGYLGSPSAQPGRWDAAWHMVTRARPGFGRAGPQGPGLLGVRGLQGRLTPRGGNPPSQVRDTPGTLAPAPGRALGQGRPGAPAARELVTAPNPPRIPLPLCGPWGPRSLGAGPGKSRGASSRCVESRPEAGPQPPASGWAWVGCLSPAGLDRLPALRAGQLSGVPWPGQAFLCPPGRGALPSSPGRHNLPSGWLAQTSPECVAFSRISPPKRGPGTASQRAPAQQGTPSPPATPQQPHWSGLLPEGGLVRPRGACSRLRCGLTNSLFLFLAVLLWVTWLSVREM